MRRILILGGTGDARALAARLANSDGFEITLSLAGRTSDPLPHAVPVITGGFGGADGLADHLVQQEIDLLVDATHPFAERMSVNAAAAARRTGVPLLALRRPPWERRDGDCWTPARDATQAVAALGPTPRRVFLSLGRQEVEPFTAAPQHFYLIRSVEPADLDVPNSHHLLARGPFAEADERALLIEWRIDMIVSKNSGGDATYGKIAAARGLGIGVVMLERPHLPPVDAVASVDAAERRIHQLLSRA